MDHISVYVLHYVGLYSGGGGCYTLNGVEISNLMGFRRGAYIRRLRYNFIPKYPKPIILTPKRTPNRNG